MRSWRSAIWSTVRSSDSDWLWRRSRSMRSSCATFHQQNLDNEWNASALIACEQAKSMWVQVTSRKGDGIDGYQTRMARDTGAFPEPQWPTQSLTQLLEVTFANRMIDHENHPGLLRLIGARQELG